IRRAPNLRAPPAPLLDDMRVDDAVDTEHSIALARKGGSLRSVLSAPDVGWPKFLRRALYPSEAHTHSAVVVGPAETAAIPPGSVEAAVFGPGHGPEVASRRQPHQMLDVPVETLDDGAGWVRGLDGRAALIRPCDHHAPAERERTQE